ncbi:MAG: hypothetical protein R3B54_09825 [Bdellovibrionota bacterium]
MKSTKLGIGFRLFLALLLVMGPITPAFEALADTDFLSLELNEESLVSRYGEYFQTEIYLAGNQSGGSVYWEVSKQALPAGLEIEDTDGESLVLFGTPVFTGKLVF